MKKVFILKSMMVYEDVQVIHGAYATLKGAEKEMKELLEEESHLYYDFEIEETLFFE